MSFDAGRRITGCDLKRREGAAKEGGRGGVNEGAKGVEGRNKCDNVETNVIHITDEYHAFI